MQYIATFAAMAGMAAAFPGYGPSMPGMADCHTSSTCKAIITTYQTIVPYTHTLTMVHTTYRPVTRTTTIESNVTQTTQVPTTYHITKTIPVTKYVTIPEISTKVVCKTETISSHKTSSSVKEEYSTCPETKKVASTIIKPTHILSTYVTSSACPVTETQVEKTHSVSICSETVQDCKTMTSCESEKPAPTHPAPAVYPTGTEEAHPQAAKKEDHAH